MRNTIPFSKKSSFKTGVINKLQIEKDDIDDETLQMLEQKTVAELSNENDIISQEITKLNNELLDINDKSNNIEALLKSQQQCISILNKDNEELEKLADQAEQALMGKTTGRHKKSKHIKESDLISQIHTSIEKQESLVNESILLSKEDPEIIKIKSIRESNLQSSINQLSKFNEIILHRQNLIDRFKEYSDEMINHTKQNKLIEEYENLKKENQALTEIFTKRKQQKQTLEKKKKKLADINESISEMEFIKEKINKIEEEIESQRNYTDFSQMFLQDAQNTQTQSSDEQFVSIGCMTDGPFFNSANDAELKMRIIQFEKEITDIQQQKDFESSEIMKMIEIKKDQCKKMYQELDLLSDHLSNINS